MTRLRDETGQPIQLGDKLGQGGEGEVFRLAGKPSLAVKVYSAPLSPDRIEKIRVLASLGRTGIDRIAACPTGLVLDERGAPRGLLLPVVEHGLDIHHLYTPSSRRAHFPSADWRFLLHVGRNVARAFASVHSAGLVIGDVNPSSMLVLRDGTVRLIDVDSFQVTSKNGRVLLCTVGVSLFLPPELQKASLTKTIRTKNHDSFGLAVTLFQLLMLGRHPFAGRFVGGGDMPIDQAILEQRFAYGARAHERGMQRPPHTIGLEALPPALSSLFEAAFSPGSAQQARPPATDWITALDQTAADLAQCGRSPSHLYPRSAGTCPWCPLEQATGVILFGAPTAPAQATTSPWEAEFQKLLRVAAAIPSPRRASPLSPTTPATPNPDAQRTAGTSSAMLVGYCLGLAFVVTGVGLLRAGSGGLILILSGFVAFTYALNSRTQRRQAWVEAYKRAVAEHAHAVREFEAASAYPAQSAARTAIAEASHRWDDLPRRRSERRRQLEAKKRQSQMLQFLELQRIENSSIKGVGPNRLAMLSAYGIDTAADTETSRILQVPQFGPVLADRLVAWRRSRERAFVYDPARPLPRVALDALDREIEDLQRKLVESVRRSLRDLQTAAATEPTMAEAAAQRLVAVTTALQQAEADVVAATGAIPGRQ